MTYVVKNEEDLIEQNIQYHIESGVDYFIALDNGSNDNTTKILRKYVNKGILRYLRDEGVYDQEKWARDMCNIAVKEMNPDWLISNDADEFWYSKYGNLKRAFRTVKNDIDSVLVPRHNMTYTSLKKNKILHSAIYRRRRSKNLIGDNFLPGKVAFRPGRSCKICKGAHKVEGINVEKSNVCEIFHFPVRDGWRELEVKTKKLVKTEFSSGRVARTMIRHAKKDPAYMEKLYRTYLAPKNPWLRYLSGYISDRRFIEDYKRKL